MNDTRLHPRSELRRKPAAPSLRASPSKSAHTVNGYTVRYDLSLPGEGEHVETSIKRRAGILAKSKPVR